MKRFENRHHKRFWTVMTAVVVLLAAAGLGTARYISADPETVTVSDTAGLRNALASGSAAVIKLDEGVYSLGGTPLVINRGVTVIGAGGNREGDAAKTKIVQNGTDRAVIINDALNDTFADVSLEALTVTGGKAAAADESFGGAGILADTGTSALSLYNVTVSDNNGGANGDGGGLFVSGLEGGKLKLDRVTVANNVTQAGGGGLYVEGDMDVSITRSAFDHNTAGSRPGGGVDIVPASAAGAGPVTITDSAFIGNAATGNNGGGLNVNVAAITVQNTTFSGNSAQYGGGIVSSAGNGGSAVPVFDHITVAENSSFQEGGGLYIAGGSVQLTGSIVSGNTTANPAYAANADIAKDQTAPLLDPARNGYNVVYHAQNMFAPGASSSKLGADAGLGAIGDHGGFTPTYALQPDSPAIGIGGTASLVYDQRGFPRMTGEPSAGAYEMLQAAARYGSSYSTAWNVQDGAAAVTVQLASESVPGLITSSSITSGGTARTFNAVSSPDKAGRAIFTVQATRQVGGTTMTIPGTFVLDLVPLPDVAAAISMPADVYQGQADVPITVTVRNAGTKDTSGEVKAVVTIPAGLMITSADVPSNWTKSSAGGTYTFSTTASLPAGSSAVFTLHGSVSETAAGAGQASVTANGGGEAAEDGGNNNASSSYAVHEIPQVISVAAPDPGYYKKGDELLFNVQYDRAVQVTGHPSLLLYIGSSTVEAAYKAGSGTSQLQFAYSITDGLADYDGISLGTAIQLNGAILESLEHAPASLTLNSVSNTSGVVIDAQAPSSTAVALPVNGYYKSGDTLNFVLHWNEKIKVSGQPSIPVQIGGTTVQAVFTALSPAQDEAAFTYTVQAADDDPDGITLDGSIMLNGGSITDLAGIQRTWPYRQQMRQASKWIHKRRS
ncbi:choice-of-anchor Q domain-containing protein [Paenibacillus protaetiae]|uniref:DUF11 domain-containing protein n=1 Tax=Paenibacillus protaetiae TaxID=2509456 RepID=A0A4P6EVQ5_9BACL|nr:choice-of-anchor Q domain-containing protein [Paenibacillus protaetiae]QAY67084.1 hypothetical protein ET464_12445 [Paenibacillus protaetiae]